MKIGKLIVLCKIKEDYRLGLKKEPNFMRMVGAFILVAGFRLAVLYRIAHYLRINKFRITAAIFTRIIRLSSPVDIEISVEIGSGVVFPHPLCIVIGGRARIGRNCKIMQGVSIGGSLGRKKEDGQSQPYIGDNVFIGAGAKIIGPVTIGNNVTIGANSVVTKDVPDNSNAYGIPIKIFKKDSM